MIALFNQLLYALTKYVAWIGMLFLLGAVGITTADVMMRKLDFGGIFGAVDLIQLMVMTAAYLSIPFAFMSRSHVAVSILADMASRRVAALFQLLGSVLGACFMFAIAWFGYEQAVQQAEYGDVSMTFGLPMTYYWIPLLLGAALSVVVTVHIAVEALYTLVTGCSGIALEEF
jgi:TRAP-type C4-dicarboxylate transport system permease small subunit